MAIHRFYNKDWAIGMTWYAPVIWPATGRERRKSRALRSQKVIPVGYAELETPVGYQLGATTDSSDLGLECAAALLAQTQQSAVLIEQLAADLYWLCTIEDGAVFPAGDLVGTKDLITERLREIRSDIEGKSIPIYDKSRVFDIDDAIEYDFSDLVEDRTSESDITCRPVKAIKFGKTTVSTLAGAVVLSLAFGAWQYFNGINQSEQQQLLHQQAAEQSLNQEILTLQQSLAQNSPALLATFADHIFERPMRAAGWRTHSYEWRDDAIEVTWHRGHGSITDITEHLGPGEFKFHENGNTVTEKLAFPATIRTEEQNLETRLSDQTDRFHLLETIATLPGKWTLRPPKPIGKLYPATRSQLSGTSAKLHEMIETAFSLKNLPVQVSRIKVTLDDSFKWELEGNYFAKTE